MLSIYNLDGDFENPLCTLGFGEHILGRGEILKCIDKRVSRKHVQINFSESLLEITAKHEINPCFYKSSQSKHISILEFNKPIELNDNDTFGFFPDNHWYRVKIKELLEENEVILEDHNATGENQDFVENNSRSPDRIIEDINENSEDFLIGCSTSANESTSHENTNEDGAKDNKSDDRSNELNDVGTTIKENKSDDNNSEDLLIVNATTSKENTDAAKSNCDNIDDVEIKKEPLSQEVSDNNITNHPDENVAVKVEIKNEIKTEVEIKVEPDINLDDVPTTSCAQSSTDQRSSNTRDRCWYGARCYRKNAEHKAKFSHPGDNDYDTDPDDSRQQCVYGGQCYRRNADHRREFKHSRFGTNKPTTKHKRNTPPNSDNEDGSEINPNNIVTGKRRKVKPAVPGTDDSGDENKEPFQASDSDDDFHMISEEDTNSDYE